MAAPALIKSAVIIAISLRHRSKIHRTRLSGSMVASRAPTDHFIHSELSSDPGDESWEKHLGRQREREVVRVTLSSADYHANPRVSIAPCYSPEHWLRQ